MNKFSNTKLAISILDQEGDLAALLARAKVLLGDDSDFYCVSSQALIQFILTNRHSSLKIIWLHEICSRLIYLENKDAARLFDVRVEE